MSDSDDKNSAATRVDKWLWAARCFKTRSAASAACDGGHVKVNDTTAKAARTVKPGDLIEALTPGGRRILRVVAIGERRGSVAAAQALFEDLTPPPPPVEPDVPRWNRGEGKPNKRERRQFYKLRGY